MVIQVTKRNPNVVGPLRLTARCAEDPDIKAAWIGGSAVTGGYDDWSDLDVDGRSEVGCTEPNALRVRLRAGRGGAQARRKALGGVGHDRVAIGIGVVWLYAAIRPRYGPGAGTAVKAGVALVLAAAHRVWDEGWFPGGVLMIDMFGYDAPENRVGPEVALASVFTSRSRTRIIASRHSSRSSYRYG